MRTLALVTLLIHGVAGRNGEASDQRLSVTPPDLEATQPDDTQSNELALTIRRFDEKDARWVDLAETDVLYAADAVELCVKGRRGYVTVWSFTDTKADRLWAGPLAPPELCLGSDGPQKLWIGYGGEHTEFVVFWSEREDMALGVDAFVPRRGAVSGQAVTVRARRERIARVVEVMDREREKGR